MNTVHYKERLSEFVDQQLPADLRQAVGEHLMQCDECRREHDSIRLGGDLAAKLELSDAPASVWMAIENELDGAHTQVTMIPDRRPFNLQMAGAFALAIIVVGLFTGLVYRGLFSGEAPTVVTRPDESPVPAIQPITPGEIVQPPALNNSNGTNANVPATNTPHSNAADANVTLPPVNENIDYW
ncbi:MAG: zf-HC2 domain-containing protein, partial [Pyrinomonadaceae bacterium]